MLTAPRGRASSQLSALVEPARLPLVFRAVASSASHGESRGEVGAAMEMPDHRARRASPKTPSLVGRSCSTDASCFDLVHSKVHCRNETIGLRRRGVHGSEGAGRDWHQGLVWLSSLLTSVPLTPSPPTHSLRLRASFDMRTPNKEGLALHPAAPHSEYAHAAKEMRLERPPLPHRIGCPPLVKDLLHSSSQRAPHRTGSAHSP